MSPDDECGVCGTQRDQHGDMNHEFNLDGVLIRKKAPPSASEEAPRTREEAAQSREAGVLAKDPTTRLTLRLVERLVAKGLFDGEDMLYIFGGKDAPDRG